MSKCYDFVKFNPNWLLNCDLKSNGDIKTEVV